jgi:hypothetical protein
MNRLNLKTYGLARCAGLKALTVGTNLLDIMVQNAANDVAFRCLCLKENSMFSVIADQARYTLSTVISNYVCMGEAGVWWGGAGSWKELKPKTLAWLKENRKEFLNEDSGEPEYFVEDGNELLVVPAPETSLTDGFWIDFYQKAYNMTDDTHFPFYGLSEISKLACLDEAIIAHFRWKGLGIVGKSDDYNLSRNEYEGEIQRVQGLLLRNKALSVSPYSTMQGRKIR